MIIHLFHTFVFQNVYFMKEFTHFSILKKVLSPIYIDKQENRWNIKSNGRK